MNLIKELAEKYEVPYFEDRPVKIATASGTYTYHPGTNTLAIDGILIQLNFNPVTGNSRHTESSRISIALGEGFETSLMLSPKSKFQRMMDSLLIQKTTTIQKEFELSGDIHLIENLVSNPKLARLLEGERIYLKIDNSKPAQLSLCAQYGITKLQKFEKYLEALRLIRQKALELHLTCVY